MEALYDQRGAVHAWLDTDCGNILDLRGQHLAFIQDDGVYDWQGRHIGWWIDGCVRDARNAAAYFTASAGSLGVMKPMKQMKPSKPTKSTQPMRPMRQMRPMKPMRQMAWSNSPPF